VVSGKDEVTVKDTNNLFGYGYPTTTKAARTPIWHILEPDKEGVSWSR
jgi:hypothetical protein